jgi:hypothetical protein
VVFIRWEEVNYDLIFKLIGPVVSLISFIFAVYNIRFNNRKKLIDEFTVAKAFFEDLDNLKNKFVIEKGYQAIAGSDRFDIDVIKHLLLFPNPSRALKDYRHAYRLFKKHRENGRLKFKWCFRPLWVRKSLAVFYFFKYWLSGMAVFYAVISPLYIPKFVINFFILLGVEQKLYFTLIIFIGVISLYFALSSLYKLSVLCSAFYLFKQEDQWFNFK